MKSSNNPDKISTFSSYSEIKSPTNFFSDFFSSQANKQNEFSNQFFDYKKIRIFFLWSVLFLIIIGLVLRFFLNLDLIKFLKKLSEISGNEHFLFTMISGFLFFGIADIFLRAKILKVKLHSKLKNVKFSEWVSYGVISFFIQSITPFSIGSEPYTIWWLSKKGISVKEATAVVAVSSFCWFIGQFLITWPSFIYLIASNWAAISNFTITKIYWAVIFGLLVDIFIGCLIFGISYAKKLHYKIALVINFFKKHIGINYLEKSELEIKYLYRNSFQKVYLKNLKDKSTYKVIALFIIQNIFYYLLFVFVYKIFLFQGNNSNNWELFNIYNIVNVSTTANNFLPLPSSEGSLQFVIQSLIVDLNKTDGSEKLKENISNIIFLWRFFTKYFGLILSFFFLIVSGFNFQKRKVNKYSQFLKTEQVLVF